MSTASASWRWDALFAAAGGLALAVQIYLLRDYLVALQGDEAAVGLGLAIWLAAIAAGAALARAVGGAHPGRGAAAALVLLASTGFAGALLARVGRSLLALPAGELLALGPALVLALLVFVLPGGCVGAGFVWLAAAATRHGTGARRAIGRLYAIEALGSLAAGLAVSLLAIPRLPPLTGLLLLLAFGLGAAVPAVLGRLIGGRWSIPVAAAVALLAARPPAAGRLEAATQRVRFASLAPGLPLLGWADTPYEHVAIGGGEIRALYAGGQYVTSFPDPDEDEPRAHQLMLLAERPRRVLALGGLETGALRFCLQHPVERLDLVQLDRGAFDLVRRHLPPADRAALADPRVRVIFEDPRRFLVRSSDRYDLVLHLQPDPATLLVARSSTVEFGRLVAARLGPGGVYAVRFSAGASVQTGATGMMGASLFRSLAAVFPVVHAAPALGGLLVAGLAPAAITLAPEPLAARYRARGLTSELFAPELLPLLFPPERAAALEGELRRAAAGVDASSDDRPVSLLYALSVRQQVARSAWATVLDWAAAHPAWLVLVFLCPGLLLLFRQLALRPARDPAAAALHATAATGACGMAWSLLLFFSFQTRGGALYSQLGTLAALFMVGLALGGAWSALRAARSAVRPGLLLRAQAVALGGAVLLALVLAALGSLGAGQSSLAALHALLLVVAGASTGVVFPAAASALLDRGAPPPAAAALVELADHAGAALAALATAVLLVPLLGLTKAAALLVAVQALALAQSAAAQRAGGRGRGQP